MKFISFTTADGSAIPALESFKSISFIDSKKFKVVSVENDTVQALTEAEEGQDVLLLSFSLEDGETLKVDDILTEIMITKTGTIIFSINGKSPFNKILRSSFTTERVGF